MADKSMKSATRVFGLGRSGTEASESTEARNGHPLAIASGVRRQRPIPTASIKRGLAAGVTTQLD